MVLPVLVRRHCFEAQDVIRFPVGKAANLLRGGFGTSLRAVASLATYERIFEPKSNGGPSGLADPPRPFLFRAWQLDGRDVAKHDDFEFDVHIFGDEAEIAPIITAALVHLFEKGAGVGRGRATLTACQDERIEIRLLEPETAERVFEPYYTTKAKGTGLGLATVKHNVELYGGNVRVESKLGKGARFVLLFPGRTHMKSDSNA